MRPEVIMKAGLIPALSPSQCHISDRWGDYFGAAIDPADGSAWLVGQYAKGDCWATWIGNLDWSVAP
jgi:hypothetical protein